MLVRIDLHLRVLEQARDLLLEEQEVLNQVAGQQEVLKQEVQINVVSSPGSIFGEVSLLLGRPPHGDGAGHGALGVLRGG